MHKVTSWITALVLVLAVVLSQELWGQESKTEAVVTASVVDASGVAMPLANVFLIKDIDNPKAVAHSVGNQQGRFTLRISEAGTYILNVSYLGYKLHRQSVSLELGKSLDLGTVVLVEEAQELQTVVVMGEPIRVRTLPNGFSIRVDKLRQTSNDALDLLRRLPNIQVQENKLSVLGKQNVVVQIGNVLQRVPASQLPALLKGYDAGLIEQVEVLMQPPLRYDPDGDTAMIILHTSPAFREYLGGRIGSELIQGVEHNNRYGGYGSLHYNRKKLYWSLSPSYNRNRSVMQEDVRYLYPNYTYRMLTPSDGTSTYGGGRATLQYQHNKRGHLGFTVSYSRRQTDNLFESYERYTPRDPQRADMQVTTNYSETKPKLDATAYWEQALGRNKSKMWLEMVYLRYQDRSDKAYSGREELNQQEYLRYQDRDRLKVSSWGINNDYSLVLDSLGRYKLDVGLKLLHSATDNGRDFAQWAYANPTETYQQANALELSELWLTPYLSSTMRFSQAWWLRLGLRAALTSRELTLRGQGAKARQNDLSWLPSLHLSYAPSRQHKIYLTLNSAVTQPQFAQLNPFEWRVGQQSYFKGNTELKPERNYSYALGYTYKGRLSISATIKQGRDLIAPITTIGADDKIYTRTENAQHRLFYGVEADYYWDELSWLTLALDARYGQTRYSSWHPQLSDGASGREWAVGGYASFVFNKSRTLTGYLSGSYTGRKQTAVSTINPTYDVGAGVSWALLGRRLVLSLSGMELFAPRYRGYSQRANYRIEFNNRFSYPSLYFSVSYKFFKGKSRPETRRSSTRDLEQRL